MSENETRRLYDVLQDAVAAHERDNLHTGGLMLAAFRAFDAHSRKARRGQTQHSNGSTPAAPESGASSSVVVMFGNSKGKRLGELLVKDLRWYFDVVGSSIADPEKANFRKKNELLYSQLRSELRLRGERA